MSGKRNPTPYDIAYPHQRQWADDRSRFKIGCMARQVGKDWAAALEGILDCYTHEIRGQPVDWLIASPSERQSLEALDKWKQMARGFGLSIHDYKEERDNQDAVLKSASIVFRKGSRVIAVPGKPETVRGYSANVLMTEFAFFEKPDETWKAILPAITNPLRGGEKKARIISTPNGQGNKFHSLWEKNFVPRGTQPKEWSCHRITIHDAKANGMPIDIEALRSAIDDEQAWLQEEECEFTDASGVLLTYELIGSCESDEATEVAGDGFWDTWTDNPLFIGVDFGRSVDLTAAWTFEQLGDVLHSRELLALRNMPTPEQVQLLNPRVARSRVTAVDYTGPGVGLGDYLVKEHGEYNPDQHMFGKVMLCKATNALNVSMFSKLRMMFQNQRIRVPINRVIREDLHSVYRVPIMSGVAYRAPHSANGHADRCYAAALAGHAANSIPKVSYSIEII